MLAITAPSPGWQAFLLIVAFVLFVVAAFLSIVPKSWAMAALCAGLAAWVLVAAWTALAAT